ncbi:hypothetical protein LPTSP4_30370 [Leptospira ryugenii]|uniref:Uncharacterized protein n=1 Tax=Leptospira ryugenii TaxID=1917863 RepID=A0A2P2E3R0_9LEPT|nr:hypothetical protein LPTSP4_30370 [Leptospira ryugenii]
MRSTVQKVDTGARLQSSHGSVGVWKTESGKIEPSSLSKSLSPSQSNQFSPVFKQTKGITLMALPGNIIVELDASLDQKKAEVFFGQRGLRIVRKLDMVGRNFYEVETPAGAESLNIANSLYGQTGVISSMPNWWREVTAK